MGESNAEQPNKQPVAKAFNGQREGTVHIRFTETKEVGLPEAGIFIRVSKYTVPPGQP